MPGRRKARDKEEKPEKRAHENVTFAGGSEELRRENEQNRRKRRRIRTGTLIFVFVALITVGVIFMVRARLRTFNGIKVLHSADIQYEANANYLEFGGNLLKYTPDGVSYIDANGNVVWTAGIDFQSPIAEASGDYAVVADKGGNVVTVYNLTGEVDSVKMPYTISDIDVTSSGAFTVILENDKTNFINMYSSTGEKIYEMQTSINKSGYPLDISVSDDGKKLFTSYFRLDGVNIRNNLTAYNFGDVGQNENADRMVGGYTYDEEMFPKVQFLTNDIIAAFSDTEIQLFDMKEKPSKRASIPYDSEITSIFYSDSFLGVIAKSGSSNQGNGQYLMSAWDLNGKKLFDYNFNFDFDHVYASSDEIIVTGGNQCLIVTSTGRTKFTYSFPAMVKSVIPSTGKNEYIVTLYDKTETIRLKTENK